MQETYYEPWNLSPTITVHEDERRPQPTGILNHHGVMLYRVEERVQIGFHAAPQAIVKNTRSRKRK